MARTVCGSCVQEKSIRRDRLFMSVIVDSLPVAVCVFPSSVLPGLPLALSFPLSTKRPLSGSWLWIWTMRRPRLVESTKYVDVCSASCLQSFFPRHFLSSSSGISCLSVFLSFLPFCSRSQVCVWLTDYSFGLRWSWFRLHRSAGMLSLGDPDEVKYFLGFHCCLYLFSTFAL